MIQYLLAPLRTFSGASACAGGVPGACEATAYSVSDFLISTILASIIFASFVVLTNGPLARRLSKRIESHKISTVFIMLVATTVLLHATVFLIIAARWLLDIFGEIPIGVWNKYVSIIFDRSVDYGFIFLIVVTIALGLVGIILFKGKKYPEITKNIVRGSLVTCILAVICLTAFIELPSRETELDRTRRGAERCRALQARNILCEY